MKKFIILIIILIIFFINICQSIKYSKNENLIIDQQQEQENEENGENHLMYKRENEKRERDKIKNREIEKRRSLKSVMNLKTGSTLPLAENEKLILEKLYIEWNGDEWFNQDNKWLNGDPCLNNWYGIECNITTSTTNSNIVKLNLKSNNVKGEIPLYMKDLIYLEYIELSNNEMYGEIPIGVFENMLSLDYFAINDNLFSGSLLWTNYMPLSIVTLWISYNNFTGAGIPTFLNKYPVLDLLFLEGNTLQGTIPPEVGQLQKIKLLDFGFNELTGPIPPEIGNLLTLEFFWIYDNSLSESLPTTLGNLVNLELFEVTRNNLSGTLDGVFENNSKFRSIRFSSNNFSGDLNWICKLSGLKDAHFSSNKFQVLPDCPGQVPLGLNELLLSNNLISGTIPSSFGKFQGIEFLGLSSNSLTGTIPTSFSNFTNLNRIDISKNNFKCSLSEILDPIKYQTHLTIISANSNEIYGEFLENMFWDGEQEIELLTKMFIINLANNKISGEIKEYLSWMPNLNDLDLSNNNLSGTVPNQLNYLSTFYLENNPNLKDSNGNLPSFMKPSTIMIHKDSETFACPSIIGKGFDIRITLDSSYYNNSLCLCDYSYRGVNGSCKLCPTDSYCPGSGNQILIPSGFYPMPSMEDPEYLLKCIVSNFGKTSCNPDNSYNFTCASGYQGRLCSKCTDGYFHKGTECSVCPTGPQSIVIFVIVVIVFIALFLFFVMTDPKRSLPSSTRKTVMYYYQVFNLLLSKLSPWPSFFSIFYSGSSWLNFSFGFLCVNNLSRWPNLFIVMICLPFAFLVISIIFITLMQIQQYLKHRYGLFNCGGGSSTKGSNDEETGTTPSSSKKFVLDKKLIYSGIRVNLLALNFLYLPLCIYIFQNYPCTKDSVSGEEYMSFFPWQQCGDNPTHNRIMSLTIAFTIIYVIGIPLLFSILLFSNRKRLDHPLVLAMIGSIYIDYRRSVYWYELIALGRRFFMAVSLALIDPKSSFSIFVVLLVIGSSIISQIIFKPYVYRISNYAETIGNSVLLFSYACILLLSSLATTKLYDSKGIEIILSVVVVLYTVLLLLLFLFSLKYFLPRKWQMVVDSNLIKFINWVRVTSSNFIKDSDFLAKQNDPDDSFETTKEPIFERTISNNLNILGNSSSNNIELKRRNSSALQQSSCQNSTNNLNNSNNNNNNNNNSNQDSLISLSIDNSGTSFNNDHSNKNI